MGLDTTHDCWHGPYSQFMRWRCWLAAQVGIPLRLMYGFYEWEWEVGDLDLARDYPQGPSSDYERHSMFWNTLSGFRDLGHAIPWGRLADDPLVILLHHSDYEGEGKIRWWQCRSIAIRFGQIIRQSTDDTKYPVYTEGSKTGQYIWTDWRDGRGCYDGMIPATKRFIVGLLAAARMREDVIFY